MDKELATFAGGCFWCVQHDFDHVPGVLSTTVGYTGGHGSAPTYEEVCSGGTGHVEAIQIAFDDRVLKYEKLVQLFLHMIEPTRADGQFCDVGSQYRPAIFYHNPEQKKIAQDAITALKKIMDVSVHALPATQFYPAEEYHQKFYQKQSTHYERYRRGSKRDQRLKEIWGNR